MMRSLWTAATGMGAQQLHMDVISNNLANVNTTGFKKSRPDFEDLMYQTLRQPGATQAAGQMIPTGVQVGLGVKPVAIQKLFSQGDYQNTENQLDLAIEGQGFFKVLKVDEEVYTRSGAFKLDNNGVIVDSNGYILQPQFTVPDGTTSIVVDPGGQITALGADGAVLAQAQLTLYKFANPAGLFAIGKNLFRPTPASGAAVEGNPGVGQYGTIAQGFLEMSNVSVVDEMVNMIVAQRAYESNSKAIQTADSMLQMANNVKR
ncbi:MAG: flagellar basal-body rod protein FlgG [Desulfarculus sp.]|nr:flagellar basal-body rod protein FlgG [Desulfarculus sp.]MCA1989009.1 flagellar basal-body rod protein FlgG [Desulfarculus sp.]